MTKVPKNDNTKVHFADFNFIKALRDIPGLNWLSVLLYMDLYSRGYRRAGLSWPSWSQLQDDLKCSRDGLSKGLHELERLGMVRRWNTRRGSSNYYVAARAKFTAERELSFYWHEDLKKHLTTKKMTSSGADKAYQEIFTKNHL